MNKRMQASFLLLGSVLVFALIGIISVVTYALPRPTLISAGRAATFAPSENPYYVAGDEPFYIVNTGEKFLVLSAMATHPNACLLKWIVEESKFIEPCLGIQFYLDGTYLLGPAPRDMDRYEYQILDGILYVNVSQKILGTMHP